MPSSQLLRCLFILAIASAGACAAAPAGELLVRQGNGGVPCFTIPEAEEARAGAPNFHAITVSEAGAKTPVWKMVMPPQRTFPVTFRMCVPYAGRLPVLPQTPAATLQPGKVYEVAIDARGPRPASAPRDYRARFCLVAQRDGALLVRHVALGNARQRPSCAAL
ncbi:hypothetical protein [Massilia sp. TSP1-1-2]|uniref:hypothetical protein n=1 Tax=unclassified Massilia TaxID=2609279 RepID=UPI003CEA7E49